MHAARTHPLARLALVGVAGAALTAGLLWAQVRSDDGQTEDTPAPTTQPALLDADLTPHEIADLVAREGLISGLIGSKHDFTAGRSTGRELCLPCHTPHLVSPPTPRLDRRPTTTQPLRPYQKPGVELDSWSLLCLGCHDGVSAPDVYSMAHATQFSGQLANSRVGVRALRSHPVGIEYPVGREDYHPRHVVEAAGLPMADGRIQCGTCHDAHNTHRYEGMLHISNERSRLCLTCHRL